MSDSSLSPTALFEALFELTPSAVALADGEGRYLDVNPAYCDLLGYTRSELLGRRFDLILPPALQPRFGEILQLALRNDSTAPSRWQVQCRDGRLLEVTSHFRTLHDAQGQARILTSLTDVTESEHTRAQLASSASQLEVIAAHVADAIALLDAQGHALVSSQSCQRLFEDGQGMTLTALLRRVAPGERAAVLGAFQQALQAGQPAQVEYRWFGADGQTRLLDTRFNPVPDRGQVVMVSRDITQQREVEDGLRVSEMRLRELSESIQEVFWITDPHSQQLLYVSPAYQTIWGRDPATLYQRPTVWLEHVHPEDRPRVQAALPLQREGSYDVEYRVLRPDGSQRWVHDRAYPVRDASGAVVRVTGVATDITGQKLASEEVLRLNAELEQRVAARTQELSERVNALALTEEALRKSEERYRQVVENVSEGIIITQGNALVFANPRVRDISGYSMDELANTPFTELLHPDDVTEVMDRAARRLRGEDVKRYSTFRVRRRNGEYLWLESSAVTILWEGQPAILAFLGDLTERHAAEEAIRQSEEQYRHVVNNVTEGILIVQNGHIVFVNPRVEAMTGYDRTELLALPFLHAVHPDDRALVADRHVRRLRGETVESHYTFRVRQKAGTEVWIELSAVMIEWNGAPATLSFITDISERKQLQDSLRQTLDERETILENSIVGIAFLDAAGRTRWANQAMSQVFGVQLNDCIGQSLEPFYLSREQYLRTGGEVFAAVQAGQSFTTELPMRRADGSSFWVHLTGKAVNGRDLSRGTVWVVMDITARKLLEEQLRHKTFEQEAILHNTLVGITFSVAGVHQWVNPKLAEMLGCTADELLGRALREHMQDPRAWDDMQQRTQDALGRGGACLMECQLQRKDGSLLWAELSGRALEPGQLGRGVIWTLLDITARRQAETDIRLALSKQQELNELKSRFVSMASHEFRTPLAAILSATELVRDYSDRLSAADRNALLASIESAVTRMTTMLEQVLVIGRAEAQAVEFDPAPLQLASVCRAVMAEVTRAEQMAGRDGDRIDSQLELDDGLVALDESLVRHILSNLLSNALKYSPGGQPVAFRVTMTPSHIHCEVRDHGIGIPAEDLPNLFESFHRAHNVGNIAGTGLGLSIVKHAVELHGGDIRVESQLGSGTTFRVVLPRKDC